MGELSVTINSNPQHEMTQIVTIQLPQSDPEAVLVLADNEQGYQRIGFTLQSRQLTLFQNCTQFFQAELDSLPGELPIEEEAGLMPSVLTIFETPTRVSVLCVCVCVCVCVYGVTKQDKCVWCLSVCGVTVCVGCVYLHILFNDQQILPCG